VLGYRVPVVAEPTRRRSPFLAPPPTASPELAHNWAATQREAWFFGALEAAAAVIAVLLVRLGATNLEIGILSALAPLATFLLAVPFGSFVQTRRNAVPWYSRGRAIGQLIIPIVGIVVLVAPGDLVIPLVLVAAAICAVFQAFADLVFWVVMDGVAGPEGRYSLMGHRLGLKMGVSAGAQAAIGAFLTRAPFPLGYALVFIASAANVWGGYRYSRTLRVPDHPPMPPRSPSVSWASRVSGLVGEVAGERRFLGFTGTHTLFAFGVRMALPLLPLWYVRELDATDAFIGLVGTVMAGFTMIGYFLWRRPARRLGGTRILVPTTLGVALFPLALALAHTDATVLVFVAVYAFCIAGMDLAMFDALMRAMPPDRSVRFAALDTGAVNFAGVVAPLTGAALASALGLAPALAAAAVVGVLGSVGLSLAVARRRVRGRHGPLRRG
jgi:Na+/melibiose symporter-like transporter